MAQLTNEEINKIQKSADIVEIIGSAKLSTKQNYTKCFGSDEMDDF